MTDTKIRIVKAIKNGTFNYENYLNGGTYYGTPILTQPLHCSYGQIGYIVFIEDKPEIKYDWEKKEIRVKSGINFDKVEMETK